MMVTNGKSFSKASLQQFEEYFYKERNYSERWKNRTEAITPCGKYPQKTKKIPKHKISETKDKKAQQTIGRK